MRYFAVAADVIMGAILGVFVFAGLSRTWPALNRPAYALISIALFIVVVLFRRPHGTLATRRDQR
ncbi:MAG: hypothetical protein LC753_14510 [Acidobacteria bacterium]|nr:hypothetical protein [Acidobacteriota bacterium]MCA1651426.1 hypothetical protein [Acidobacteriota bacterium]